MRIPEKFLEDSFLCHSTFRTAAAQSRVTTHLQLFIFHHHHPSNKNLLSLIIPPCYRYEKSGKEFPKEKLLNEMEKERDENDKQ